MIELRNMLLNKTAKVKPVYRRLLSSGLFTLNCALSGSYSAGIESGSVVWISGSSDSGRTVAALTFLAEAANSMAFDRYNLYFHDTENKRPQIKRLFGNKLSSRLNRITDCSLERFWDSFDDDKFPCLYVLDSLDGLTSDTVGWRVNNKHAKKMFDHIRVHDSILIILSQQKIVDCKKVSSGGAALPFYSDYIIYTDSLGNRTAHSGEKSRTIGINARFEIIKRKYAGRFSAMPVPIFSDYGYDNAEAIIDFLVLHRKITVDGIFEGAKWTFDDMGWTGVRDELLQYIRENEKVLGYYLERCAIDG